MKQVKEIPPQDYDSLRDPWLGELLNGNLYLLEPADWQARYKTIRSAASAIHAAAIKRSVKATVAVRGETLYVQAVSANGAKAPAKKAMTAKATPAKKVPAKRPAKKVAAA